MCYTSNVATSSCRSHSIQWVEPFRRISHWSNLDQKNWSSSFWLPKWAEIQFHILSQTMKSQRKNRPQFSLIVRMHLNTFNFMRNLLRISTSPPNKPSLLSNTKGVFIWAVAVLYRKRHNITWVTMVTWEMLLQRRDQQRELYTNKNVWSPKQICSKQLGWRIR